MESMAESTEEKVTAAVTGETGETNNVFSPVIDRVFTLGDELVSPQSADSDTSTTVLDEDPVTSSTEPCHMTKNPRKQYDDITDDFLYEFDADSHMFHQLPTVSQQQDATSLTSCKYVSNTDLAWAPRHFTQPDMTSSAASFVNYSPINFWLHPSTRMPYLANPQMSPYFLPAVNTPGLHLAPGNTPGLHLAPVNTPGLHLAPGNTPSLHLAPVNTPGLHLAPGNTPGFHFASGTPGLHVTPVYTSPLVSAHETAAVTSIPQYPTPLYSPLVTERPATANIAWLGVHQHQQPDMRASYMPVQPYWPAWTPAVNNQLCASTMLRQLADKVHTADVTQVRTQPSYCFTTVTSCSTMNTALHFTRPQSADSGYVSPPISNLLTSHVTYNSSSEVKVEADNKLPVSDSSTPNNAQVSSMMSSHTTPNHVTPSVMSAAGANVISTPVVMSSRQRLTAVVQQLQQRQAVTVKPPFSYIELIARALLQSASGTMLLADIYNHLASHYTCFSADNRRQWHNSVRHSLATSDCFVKLERRGKGWLWAIHPACQLDFSRGNFSRRNARQKVADYHRALYPSTTDS